MSNIEDELRRLGDRLANQGSAGEVLPPRQRRRIKVRRALFAAGGAMTAMAVVATASYGLGLARDQRDIAPAEDASSTLIRFDRSGGFTGDHHVLTINDDGSALLESPGSRGLAEPIEFEVEPDVMATLRDAVDTLDWASLEERKSATNVTVADGYRIEISHDGYNVIIESPVKRRAVRPLVDLLNGIIDQRLKDAVEPQPTPSQSPQSEPEPTVGESAVDPSFPSGRGWHVASTADVDTFVNPTAWAWTADLDVEFPVFPTDLLPTMSESDVFISVELPMPEQRPAQPNESFPRGQLPLSLEDAEIHRSWEGQPDKDVVMYRISRTIDGMLVDARFFFATQEPDAETLVRANEQLGRLILPPQGLDCVGDGFCLSRSSAPAGARVEVAGPSRGRTKGGSPVRRKRVEVWWNLEPKEWTEAVVEGDRDEEDPSLIAAARVRRGGRFVIDFEVPRAEPGTYPLVLIIYSGGGASHVPFRFVVTE